MKLITKNSQIVVGGVYNKICKEDIIKQKQVIVEHISDEYMKFTNGESNAPPEDRVCAFYYELISYPPRRPVTWEWVKENIDHVPGLEFYYDNGDCRSKHTVAKVCRTFLWDEVGDNWIYEHPDTFIDPPHPEVPDVPAPWEAKTELETRKLNGTVITQTWVDEDKPAEEKKSLWWIHYDNGVTLLTSAWATLTETRITYKHGCKIQPVTRPVHEGPDSEAWISV